MRFLNPTKDGRGHYGIFIEGQFKKIHRLVYEAFVGPIKEGYDIHHIDKIKENQNPSNLLCISHEVHSWLHSLTDEQY